MQPGERRGRAAAALAAAAHRGHDRDLRRAASSASRRRRYLPDDVDEAAVVEAAARRGVAVYGLAPYRISCEGRPGLIFGYATLDERVLAEGIEILAEALRTGIVRTVA